MALEKQKGLHVDIFSSLFGFGRSFFCYSSGQEKFSTWGIFFNAMCVQIIEMISGSGGFLCMSSWWWLMMNFVLYECYIHIHSEIIKCWMLA